MWQILPLSTFLFRWVLTRQQHWHGPRGWAPPRILGPRASFIYSPSPGPSPGRTHVWATQGTGFWGSRCENLRREVWPEKRFSLTAGGRGRRPSPELCHQGRRPRRPLSQQVAWWRRRFGAGGGHTQHCSSGPQFPPLCGQCPLSQSPGQTRLSLMVAVKVSDEQ